MKKLALFSILCLFIFLNVRAQTKSDKVELTWGEEATLGSRYTFDDIIGTNESGIYILKKVTKGKFPVLIEKYSNQMKLIKSGSLSFGKKKEERYFLFAAQIDQEIILFTTFFDKKKRIRTLFAQILNPTTLKLSSKLTKVASRKAYNTSIENASQFFFHQISRNKEKVLIYYNLLGKKEENKKFAYHVYDKNLNELWKKEATLPFESALIELIDFQIGKNGDLYLLSKVYEEKVKNRKKGKPDYRYQIIEFTNKGLDTKEYPVILEDKFLSEMQIALNANGTIICAGFYSNIGNSNLNGSFFLTIDAASKKIITKNFKEFGLDFITQNMTDKEKKQTEKKDAKGKDIELYQYDLDDIILRDDGGAILIGEQFYIRVTNYTTSQGNINSVNHYYYNDIIVISINPKGEIDWTEKIAKRQHTTNDNGYFSSYVLTVANDNLNFIFNDNVRNLTTSKITAGKYKGRIEYFTKKFKESVAVLVQLDSDGRQVKEALFNAKEAELLIRPKVCEQISDKALIIYGQKRKVEQFGKVRFK